MRLSQNENAMSPVATSRINSKKGLRQPFLSRFGDRDNRPQAIGGCLVLVDPPIAHVIPPCRG